MQSAAANNVAGKIDWLASYPKSGNTWMRLLLANYYSEKEEPHDINKPGVTNGIASSRFLFDNHLGINSSDLTDDEAMGLMPDLFLQMTQASDTKHWMKVHDAQAKLPDGRWLFPPEATGGIIYIIRNPLDVAVSRAFHDGHGDMEKAVNMLCDPKTAISGSSKNQLRQIMGDWSHHVKSWVDQDAIRVLIVRYEDMLQDTARELARVLKFARGEVPVNAARVEIAVRNTAFETLQAAEAKSGFREGTAKQQQFFRNGKAGDWVNHLSPAQAERIRDVHSKEMGRFGYG
jgi:aryl sulfotransferase